MPASARFTLCRLLRRSHSPRGRRGPGYRRRGVRTGVATAAFCLALAAPVQFPRSGHELAAGNGTAAGAPYAAPAHMAYLSAHTAADRMGWELQDYRVTSLPGRAAGPLRQQSPGQVLGLDVGDHQPGVNWGAVAGSGGKFAYIKATEGTYYTNPYFAQQYNGAYHAGMIRGAYHFGIPNNSSGATQARYFVSHGGGWSADGHTLPGALDIEYNPYGQECYGLSRGAMVSWIRSFVNGYHALTSRWAVIYTTTQWWSTCTGNYGGFAGNDPLWIASYAGSTGPLPSGWGFHTFWQYSDAGAFPGDQDSFNGSLSRLLALAR